VELEERRPSKRVVGWSSDAGDVVELPWQPLVVLRGEPRAEKWQRWWMRGTVLRGDYTRLRRRGDRIWIRVRPFEVIWRTTHAFRVEDVHSMETDVVRYERRRRRPVMDLGRRFSEPAITRVTFVYGTGDHASVDLFETEATVAAAFQDVLDRLAGDDASAVGPIAEDDTLPRGERTDLPPIFWRADPVEERVIDLRGEQRTFWEGDLLAPELSRDVSFNLDLGADPHVVGQWVLRQLHDDPDRERLDDPDDWFDIREPSDADRAPGDTVWVRKRRRRRLRWPHS
jgi:hypothetical protein